MAMEETTGAHPVRRPSAKGVARRQEILDRAIQVFAAKGFESTSLRAIAEAIGVSHAALLHYFPSREELLIAVLRANEENYAPEYTQRAQTDIVGIMVDAAKHNAAIPGMVSLYSAMLAGSLGTDKEFSREYFVARFENVRQNLIARIEAGQRAGLVRADVSAEALAALVIAASDGLQIQWLLEPKIRLAPSLELLQLIFEVPQ
jgi:TetR/AcrR family transcriptional regulator, transcriptional repressor of aconitase